METKRKGFNIKTRRTIAYIVLILLTIMCLFWFWVLFVNTTRTHSQITTGFSAIPGTNFVNNWKSIMDGQLPVWTGLFNSFFVATASAVLTTYFSSMTAYAIHAYRFKGRKFIATYILMIMMIPTQVTALGFLELIDKLGLDNSFIPLIVPAIASPITYFYMKQYLQSSMPLSIIEAARIDGAGEFKIFNTIVLPIIKPAIAVQAIFGFVASWNNYFTPALVLHSNEKKTLPLLIATLRSADYLKFDMGKVYMLILFSIMPVVVVYLILSRQIVEGVAVGSVKG